MSEQTEAFRQLEGQENSTLSKVLQEVKELSDFDDGAVNDRIDISQFLGTKFENNLKEDINPDQAKIIIAELDRVQGEYVYDDEVQKEINALRSLLAPIAGPVIGNEEMQETLNTSTRRLDLSKCSKDVRKISSSIDNYLGMLGGNQEYQNLKNNLAIIKSSLDAPTVQNFTKIKNFLVADGENNVVFDGSNVTPVIEGIKSFLRKLESSISNISKEQATISDYREKATLQQEQLKDQRATFDKFSKLIPNGIDNLSELSNSERKNIELFINNPENKDIVLNAYLIMLENQNNMPSGTTRRDKGVFDNIKTQIETMYNEESRGKRELDTKVFTGIQFFQSWIRNNPEREGGRIDDNNNIKEICLGHMYTSEQFVATFNEKNQERINNNVDQLKNFPIMSVFSGEEKAKFKIVHTTDNQIQLHYNGTPLMAGGENLVQVLGLEEKARIQYETNTWNTNFVNLEELVQLIKSENSDGKDIRREWLHTIFDTIDNTEPIDGGDNPEEESQEINKISEIDINNTKMRGRTKVKLEDVVTTVNAAIDSITGIEDVKEKSTMTEKINKVVNALKEPGATEQEGGQTNIRVLQETMKAVDPDLVLDGKFGPNTFNAMQTYLQVGSPTQTDETVENDPDAAQPGASESVERQVLSSKQEAINLLSDANLVLPGKGQIKSYLESENGIRYVQLSLLPAYKGEIDGKFGPKTLDALKTYISLYGNRGDNDNFMKNLSRPEDIVNIGNTPWLKPEEKFIALKNGGNQYKVYFQNGATFECARTVNNQPGYPNFITYNGNLVGADNKIYPCIINGDNISWPGISTHNDIPEDIINQARCVNSKFKEKKLFDA